MKKKQNKLTRVLGSVKLAVVLLTAIVAASLIGTLMPQDRANQFIYGAWWFLSLLGMLGINLITCTLTRFRMRWSRAGSLVTHLAVLMVLAGALVDGIWGERGMMILGEGMSSDTFGEAKNKLTFSIRLEDFAVERYPPAPAVVVFRDRDGHGHGSGAHQSFRVNEKGMYPIKGTKTVLSVEEVLTSASKKLSLVPMQAGGGMGIRFAYRSQDKKPVEEFTLEREKERFESQDGFIRVVLRVFSDVKTRDKELKTAGPIAGNGYIEIASSSGSASNIRIDALPGKKHKLGDGTVIEVLRFLPHFTMSDKEVQNVSDRPVNPAVRVRMIVPGEDVPRDMWLFSNFPDFGRDHGVETAVSMTYIRPKGLDYAVNLFLYAVRGGDVRYAMIFGNKKLSKGTATVGTTVSLGEKGTALEILEVLNKAKIKEEVTSTGGSEGRYGVRVRVLDDVGVPGDAVWLMEDKDSLPLAKDGLCTILSRYPGGIKDFKSKLQVIEDGKIVKEKTIEVNQPLTHGGYAFYQATYDQKRERWSGIEVVKDPGVPLVFAGFVLLVAGLIGIFYLQPMLKGLGKNRGGTSQ